MYSDILHIENIRDRLTMVLRWSHCLLDNQASNTQWSLDGWERCVQFNSMMKVQRRQWNVRPQVSWVNRLAAASLRSINKNSCYVKLYLIDTLSRDDWARVTASRTLIAASKLTSNSRGCSVASTHSHWVIGLQLKCCERLLLPMNGRPIEEVTPSTESGTSFPR